MRELRTLFGINPPVHYVISSREINPSRSPFIKLQMRILYEGQSLQEVISQVKGLTLNGATFKVVYIKTGDNVSYDEQRAIEREIGLVIRGKADMRHAEHQFGIIHAGGRWMFGECRYNTAVWLEHNQKPRHYSTALSTRVARAIVNIAVPIPAGVKIIDPCCGIGTVLIEALSMYIDIVGRDINPMAIRGARVNLEHFGFDDVVKVTDMREITDRYDTAILDLPYNLCSKLSDDDLRAMLQSARRISNKAVIVTTEPIDDALEHVGFSIVDRCAVKKGTFSRQVIVCE